MRRGVDEIENGVVGLRTRVPDPRLYGVATRSPTMSPTPIFQYVWFSFVFLDMSSYNKLKKSAWCVSDEKKISTPLAPIIWGQLNFEKNQKSIPTPHSKRDFHNPQPEWHNNFQWVS